MSTDSLLTIKQVCQFLNVSRATLYLLRRSGKLPEYTVHRGVRFKREDVEAYLQQQQKPHKEVAHENTSEAS